MRNKKVKSFILLLLVVLVISACGSKTPAGESSSRNSSTSVDRPSPSASVSSVSNDESTKNALDEVREKHPALSFTEAEEVIAPGIESLPEEWQEMTKYPDTIELNLDNLHVVDRQVDKTNYSKILKDNPEYIVPIVILIWEAYERLDKTRGGTPIIDSNTPENVAELAEFCEMLRQKGE